MRLRDRLPGRTSESAESDTEPSNAGATTESGADAGADTDPDLGELTTEDVVLSYPNSGPIVDGESIAIPAGEVTALVGPNGSGKSTILKALANQLTPDDGQVLLDGRQVADRTSKELAQELGLLSQENTAPGTLTVEDLVYHGRYPHRGFLESVDEADHAAVERAFDLVGIHDLRDREVGSLSGGQKQLAWLALVLAQEPNVLLLDEPTTYLDLHHQLRVMDVIRTLNAEDGVTVAVVHHDITQAVRFADYLIALEDGAVYDWGPPEDVVTEQLLAEVFGVDAAVEFDQGEPSVVPRRALD